MTREEIRDLTRKRLGETTSSFWTDTEIDDYINLAAKDLAQRTKSLRSNVIISSVSVTATTAGSAGSSNEYTISDSISNFFAITEMSFRQNGTRTVKLIPTTRECLDLTVTGWRSLIGYTNSTTAGVTTFNFAAQPSVPTHYYWNREEDIFGLYPPPNADNEGAYINAYYTFSHTDMTTDAESPTLPEPLHLGCVDFAAATGYDTRGWGEKANDAWQKYFARINDYMTERMNVLKYLINTRPVKVPEPNAILEIH